MAYISYAALVFLILFGIYISQKSNSSPSHDSLPIVGVPPHIFGRLVAAIRYILHADEFFKEGYRNYPSGFRIPNLFSSLVVLPTSLTKEVKNAVAIDMSMLAAVDTEFAFSEALYSSLLDVQPIHIPILRGTLTQRLGDLLCEIEEEAGLAFEEEWGPDIRGGEWAEIDAFEKGKMITSRSNYRVLMGLPLCRSYNSMSLILLFCGLVASGFHLRYPKLTYIGTL